MTRDNEKKHISSFRKPTLSETLNPDDMKTLNVVLQSVKGINSVSGSRDELISHLEPSEA